MPCGGWWGLRRRDRSDWWNKLVHAGLVERRAGHDMRSIPVVITRRHGLARRILDARLLLALPS